MAVGIAATLAITQPSGVSELVLAVGAGSLGALISDIDVGTSNSHRDADKITALSVVVVLAVFAMDYFCNTQIIERIIGSSGYLRIIAGFMHSFLALILLSFALGLIWEKAVIYFAVGFLSHLATDIFNKKKVRLLYPMKGGVSLGLFHAYGLANDIFFAIGSIVAIIEVIICIFFR